MNNWHFKLLYDGKCPLCRQEIKFLQRFNRAGHLVFQDISSPGFDPLQYGVSREEVFGVIHGVFPDGRIVRKMEVFRQAYRAVGLGWVVAPTAWPLFRWLFDKLYASFARNRFWLGRLCRPSCFYQPLGPHLNNQQL